MWKSVAEFMNHKLSLRNLKKIPQFFFIKINKCQIAILGSQQYRKLLKSYNYNISFVTKFGWWIFF